MSIQNRPGRAVPPDAPGDIGESDQVPPPDRTPEHLRINHVDRFLYAVTVAGQGDIPFPPHGTRLARAFGTDLGRGDE